MADAVLFFYILFFLCWGSFLNVAGYRLVIDQDIIFKRSACPHCHALIAWYDLLPLISWLLLRGSCRSCKAPISPLYPFIELLTAFCMAALLMLGDPDYFFGYFVLFSALIVTIRSDLETMLISRLVTLYLIPVALFFAWLGMLPISLAQSILGSLAGYGILWLTATLFYALTGKEGMGEGDMDLLACIGAFLSPWGCWLTLLFAACTGSIIGSAYILFYTKDRSSLIPFGPFLCAGAIITVLFGAELFALFGI